MTRFNNGNPTGKGIGRGSGTGGGNGRGRGANCLGNGQGIGQGNSQGFGPGFGRRALGLDRTQPIERDPGFFRRVCLGITGQDFPADNNRINGFKSAIDDLQRQIDNLKDLSGK